MKFPFFFFFFFVQNNNNILLREESEHYLLISTGGTPRRHIHWITTQHSQKRRELLNLSQRILSSNISHRRLEVHIKHVLEMLRGPHIRIVHQPDGTVAVRPRLDLRQANVPERERRQHLEKDRGPLLVREHNARLERAVGTRYYGLPGQHHEPGHVARVVLDSVREYVHPVETRGACACYRRRVAEIVGGDELGRSGRVVDCLARDVETEFREGELALGQGLRVRDDSGQVLFSDPR